MGNATGYGTALWPLALYFGAILVMLAATLAASWLLGERRRDWATDQPYESGIIPTGTARLRMSAHFYLIAMFFVLFDVQAAFIFAWAIAFREVGWSGYAGVACFIAVQAAGLVYLWREGALDWAARSRPPSDPGAGAPDARRRGNDRHSFE